MSENLSITEIMNTARTEEWRREYRRDRFAAAALAGLLANGDWTEESCTVMASRIASALIAELDKTP